MKNIYIILIPFLLVINKTSGQLSKNQWIAGGGIYSYHYNESWSLTSVPKYRYNAIIVEPVIGYFFLDQLAVGLQPSIKTYFFQEVSVYRNSIIGALGPFIRYYFLNEKKIMNVFIDVNYARGVFKSNPSSLDLGKYESFFSGVGIAAFFNEDASVEFLSGYWQLDSGDSAQSKKMSGLRGSAGFKIHF